MTTPANISVPISFGLDVTKPGKLETRSTGDVLVDIQSGVWQEPVLRVRSLPHDSEEQMETFKILARDDQADESNKRAGIPSKVRREVWRRDEGKCVKCGHRKNLEYDHIVPVSKGGSNTARNIEFLCQDCNRAKSDLIQ